MLGRYTKIKLHEQLMVLSGLKEIIYLLYIVGKIGHAF